METLTEIINWIENHPIIGTGILGAIGYTTISILRFFGKLLTKKTSDHLNPTFFARKKDFKIIATHRYEKSDSDISGYKHLGQNSRPDQWSKYITPKSSLFGLRQTIIPKNPNDILTVIIDLKGKHRCIEFNH